MFAIAIGILPIVLIEIGLRVLGIAADQTAAVSASLHASDLTAIDREPLLDLHALRPLFVPSVDGKRMEIGAERMNFFCPASFPIQKRPTTLRVFALGGSTTQGQPYRTETAFAHWLSMRLAAAIPDREIEVINCGGISYASYRVAAILNEVLTYSPDLILLYTGHNEFLESRTYERQRWVPRWLAIPVAMVSRLRVSRVIANAITDKTHQSKIVAAKTALPSEVNTLLDHVDGMEAYRRDPQWSESVHSHFERKLSEMVDACRSAGVPLVLCVPTSDLVNTPPFKSTPDPSLSDVLQSSEAKWTTIAESDSQTPSMRCDAAKSILNIDSNHALANYVLGRIAYEHDNSSGTEMRQYLIAARDNDVCPLRATTRIERAVRAYRDHEGVFLVDTPNVLDQRNASRENEPDEIADPRFFVDHVHPTIEGHQAIAAAIYRQLVDEKWLSPVENADATYAFLVEAHLKTLGEEYYGRAEQRLEGVRRWSRSGK